MGHLDLGTLGSWDTSDLGTLGSWNTWILEYLELETLGSWNTWILDNWILDKWILDKRILDTWILDKRILDKWILDKRILDKRILDKWTLDKWIIIFSNGYNNHTYIRHGLLCVDKTLDSRYRRITKYSFNPYPWSLIIIYLMTRTNQPSSPCPAPRFILPATAKLH